jgi:hypothetical protein
VRYDHGYPGLGLGLVGSEGVELQGKEFARLPRGVRLATAAPEICISLSRHDFHCNTKMRRSRRHSVDNHNVQ